MGKDRCNADRVWSDGGPAENGVQERVLQWEIGLPGTEDLIPLSHSLISLELAHAFSITLEPSRSTLDVQRASQNTFSNLGCFTLSALNSFNVTLSDVPMTAARILEDSDEADPSTFPPEDTADSRTMKRPRLVWTPQLHKRFVEVVSHLGEKSAVPKSIMQLMNVDGLTRENIASHLQKYRFYLKRLTNEGPTPSSSDPPCLLVPDPLRWLESAPPMTFPAFPEISLPVFLPHRQVYGGPTGIMGYQHPYGVSADHVRYWSGGSFDYFI